jgi:predicted transcriptional regulator
MNGETGLKAKLSIWLDHEHAQKLSELAKLNDWDNTATLRHAIAYLYDNKIVRNIPNGSYRVVQLTKTEAAMVTYVVDIADAFSEEDAVRIAIRDMYYFISKGAPLTEVKSAEVSGETGPEPLEVIIESPDFKVGDDGSKMAIRLKPMDSQRLNRLVEFYNSDASDVARRAISFTHADKISTRAEDSTKFGVRLTEKEEGVLCYLVKNGYATNKTDAIRYAVRTYHKRLTEGMPVPVPLHV